MSEIDLFADENEPVVEFHETVYRVTLPRQSEFPTKEQPCIYLHVHRFGYISFGPYSRWFGKSEEQWDKDERWEVYEWLIEWEIAEWQRIGPEDKELFVTKKFKKKVADEESA